MGTPLPSLPPVARLKPVNTVTDYAPPRRNDPARLASATIAAIDQIGDAAAVQIEEVAKDILKGAQEIHDKLMQHAEAVRGQSQLANEYLRDFCDKSMHMLEGINQLHAAVNSASEKTPAQSVSQALDQAVAEVNAIAAPEVPKFLRGEDRA